MQLSGNACSCPNKGPNQVLFTAKDINFRTTEVESNVLRCQSCGSIFPELFPTHDTLAEAYRNYYTDVQDQGRQTWAQRLINATRKRYLMRETPVDAKRVLDFGCGSGAFLSSLVKAGFEGEAWGTDLLKPSNLQPEIRWIDESDLEEGPKFDWITLSHVLEHVEDPRGLLARLSRRLTPGGRIWISTPNADSFLFRTMGRWARDVDFPRHREVFSKGGLRELLFDEQFDASFLSPPAVNAAMNARSSLASIRADGSASSRESVGAIVSTVLLLGISPFLPGMAPELVVVCSPQRAPQ